MLVTTSNRKAVIPMDFVGRYRLNLIKRWMQIAKDFGWSDTRIFEEVLRIASDTRP